jgi:hypothetical protein
MTAPAWPPTGTAKPYVRWWWLNGPFRDEDVVAQLEWFAAQGFGGVELAWLHPGWTSDATIERPRWLGPEWARLVTLAKRSADALGLGCDFTFGSVWPFGGTCVPKELGSQTFDGPSEQTIRGSWEEPETGRVLDHLNEKALEHYFATLGPAFAGALEGAPSALFCDSLEVDTDRLWSPALWKVFETRCGYRLRDVLMRRRLDDDPGALYDYKKVVGEAIVREFYAPFARMCRERGAVARVQCHGAPADLLSAYAAVDVPESETLLFPPAFSRIPASAAALAGRDVVSCETFTCIYGFPHGATLVAAAAAWKRERVEDLKLLADAVIANGVNQIVWHGAPYNGPGGKNEFYASVHVGPDSPLAPHLVAFNAYLESACAAMRRGRTASRLAVYLPNEDMTLAGRRPASERLPGAVDFWEMRTVRPPAGVLGFAPVWISRPFLAAAEVRDGRLVVGALAVPALLVDVEWLDGESLVEILRLARAGLPVAVARRPRRPGKSPDADYERRLDELTSLPNVATRVADLPVRPIVEGDDLPWFWARECGDELLVFFAHRATREIRYPMPHGAGAATTRETRHVTIRFCGVRHDVDLVFEPAGSVLLAVDASGVRRVPLPDAFAARG